MRCVFAAVAVSLLVAGCAPRGFLPGSPGRLTHGVAVGDVSATRAVVWARCDRPTSVSVRWHPQDGGAARTMRIDVTPDHDLVGKVALDDLQPATAYAYRVWCGDDDSVAHAGRFTTAPAADRPAPVRFAFGGDLGGQNACRDDARGYPIFDAIRAQSPDFFVALGDLIYADDPCTSAGRFGNRQIAGPPAAALDLATFREYWKYNRSDASYQKLLAAMPVYPVWDDHEINNDAGPRHDTLAAAPATHLLQPALQSYLEYQPIVPPDDAPARLYGSVRWGKQLEVFLLDLRQYRDANSAPDSSGHPKTMLGRAQRHWLLTALRRSDATWKVIVSSVPLSVPTGSPETGHDGWTGFGASDGFERERRKIMRAMQASTPRNFLWITTDVHFGAAFRYLPFAVEPRFVFHEMISGPLSADVLPKEEYDRSIGTERLFLYAPTAAIADYEEALSWFNFGLVDIAADGALTAKLINGRGESVYALTVVPR